MIKVFRTIRGRVSYEYLIINNAILTISETPHKLNQNRIPSTFIHYLPCLISALLIPTLAIPVTGPEFSLVATAVPAEGTTAPPGPWRGGCVYVCIQISSGMW